MTSHEFRPGVCLDCGRPESDHGPAPLTRAEAYMEVWDADLRRMTTKEACHGDRDKCCRPCAYHSDPHVGCILR